MEFNNKLIIYVYNISVHLMLGKSVGAFEEYKKLRFHSSPLLPPSTHSPSPLSPLFFFYGLFKERRGEKGKNRRKNEITF